MTRAELAFNVLDRSKTGFISAEELKKLSKKLSNEDLLVLMKRVLYMKSIFKENLLEGK